MNERNTAALEAILVSVLAASPGIKLTLAGEKWVGPDDAHVLAERLAARGVTILSDADVRESDRLLSELRAWRAKPLLSQAEALTLPDLFRRIEKVLERIAKGEP